MRRVLVVLGLAVMAGCSGGDGSQSDLAEARGDDNLDAPEPSGASAATISPATRPAATATVAPSTTTPTTSTATTTSTTTTATTTTAGATETSAAVAASTTSSPPSTTLEAATTVVVSVPSTAPVDIRPGVDVAVFPIDAEIEIGRSVEGRPITVIRRGDPNGTRVLAVGVIHGNEPDGAAIIDQLTAAPVPDGVELWLVRSMNPDGEVVLDRQNANGVDLNRNFPENWDVLGEPGFWQYAGTGPASEPETQALVSLGDTVRPDILLWYHQDLFRLAPGSGRAAEIRSRYAELSGLPIVDITGGTYTGTGAQWASTILRPDGVGITVELGPTLSQAEIEDHVGAVHAIATEFF